ncbi:MAG: chemotaxis response regulator protein-glutamate methylesterase [Chthonomonadaceae bacterium]|nr:chemotaxis response regulator protein-glutamate methylesterase [Chthonomonadaceae bacterium]
MKKRLLIVDDSPFIRRMLSDWVKEEEDIEICGVATNGEEAVKLVNELKPDFMTLDVEMPVKDGLSALEQIMKVNPLPILMVSSVTVKGAEQTLRALELGAVDFVTKPQGGNSLRFIEAKEDLLAKLRAVKDAKFGSKPTARVVRSVPRGTCDKVVLIASSTGGPRAVMSLFQALPESFPAPILVVQHMPVGFTTSFAKRLNELSAIPTREAVQGDKIEPGQALLAPGGFHLVCEPNGTVSLNEKPSIHGVRPAADYMFQSGAKCFGSKCLGVVLTGMGRDGAQGAVEIRQMGGVVLGESEATCVVYGMPKAAKDAGGIDAEFPLDEIAQAIVANLSGRLKHAS